MISYRVPDNLGFKKYIANGHSDKITIFKVYILLSFQIFVGKFGNDLVNECGIKYNKLT